MLLGKEKRPGIGMENNPWPRAGGQRALIFDPLPALGAVFALAADLPVTGAERDRVVCVEWALVLDLEPDEASELEMLQDMLGEFATTALGSAALQRAEARAASRG